MFSSTNNTTSTTVNFPLYFPLSSNYHPPLPLPLPLPHPHPHPHPLPLPHLSHVLQADQINYGDIFLHHHRDPLSSQFSLNNGLMAAPPPETTVNLGVSSNGTPKQTMNYGNINPYFLPNKEVVQPVPAKKDRHSKIFTAQGLRDRRVRLSINVAREFFDLQDLLGFDKASKTLDWLLTKSRKAIRELTRNNNKHVKGRAKSKSKSVSSTSESQVVSDVNEKDDDQNINKMKMKKLINEAANAVDDAAKESRAKARARARERTKEKLMVTTVRSCPQILNQFRFNEIYELPCEASSSSKLVIGDMSLVHQSIVTKRKMKDPCSVSNHQQKLNGIVSESTETSNGHIQFGNAPQNWDINGAFTSCPSICAITNMNLSTGL